MTLTNRVLAGFAGGILFFTLCFRLGYLPLLSPDEGRNAQVASEMNESGAWLVPTLNGMAYLDKPAFYFKTVALSQAIAGENETASRLPSALFGVALVALTFAFCRKIHGARCAWLSAIVVATTPLFIANARTVIFDMALAFFVCAAIFAGFLAEAAEGKTRRNWYLAGAASAGLATLVKGPVGFLVPTLVLLVCNGVERHRGVWRRLLAPANLIVFFAITLPWFVGLCLRHPDFLRYGLWEESFRRFTSAKTFHRSEPFYFYPVIVMATFLPWSLVLPGAAWFTWKRKWATNPADRLCIIWAVATLVFFSLSQSKLPGYILSVAVAAGILVGRLLEVALAQPESRPGWLLRRASLSFGAGCLVAGLVVYFGTSQAHLLARPFKLEIPETEIFGRAVAPFGLTLGVVGMIAFASGLRKNVLIGFLSLALFAPLTIITGVRAFGVVFEAQSSRKIARELNGLPAGTQVVCFQCFPVGLPFYMGRPALLLTADGEELTSNYIVYELKKNPWPRERVIPAKEFKSWLAARTTPVCLLFRSDARERMKAVASSRGAEVRSLPRGFFCLELPPPGSS